MFRAAVVVALPRSELVFDSLPRRRPSPPAVLVRHRQRVGWCGCAMTTQAPTHGSLEAILDYLAKQVRLESAACLCMCLGVSTCSVSVCLRVSL